MSGSSTIAYFGYGSLVNLATLRTPYISAHRVRLRGWKRTWLARPKDVDGFASVEGLAFLSVEPDPASVLDGIVIVDHAASLPDLDRREVLYERHSLSHEQCQFLDGNPLGQDDDLFLYAAEPLLAVEEVAVPRILRSYLDAVSQGFNHHFGEQGLIDFKASTNNFHFPVYEDRDMPLYPRPVVLSEQETGLIDRHFPDSRSIADT